MPCYELRCVSCAAEGEVICSYAERDLVRCPECDSPTKPIVSRNVPTVVGAMPSKPIYVGALDRTFATNAEYRRYEREHPAEQIVSTKDATWRNHVDEHSNETDKMVKKWGFRDAKHWGEVSKRERAKGGSAFSA